MFQREVLLSITSCSKLHQPLSSKLFILSQMVMKSKFKSFIQDPSGTHFESPRPVLVVVKSPSERINAIIAIQFLFTLNV